MRISALASILCASCALAPGGEKPTPLATIPIEIRSGIPTIEVTVAGQPLALMLDYGSDESISLTASELARVQVRAQPGTRKFMNPAGERLEARQFIAPDVVIGGWHVGDLKGGEAMFGSSPTPDRNGSVGRPVVERYLMVLDYPGRAIRIYPSGDARALEAECGIDTFDVRLIDGAVQSAAMTEYGKLDFVWDTGTTHNFMRPAAVPGHEKVAVVVDDGPPELTLTKLVLGGRDYAPQRFRLMPFEEPAVHGFLGAGLMSTHKVCLDLPQQKGAIR
jgi:hypothetical protein